MSLDKGKGQIKLMNHGTVIGHNKVFINRIWGRLKLMNHGSVIGHNKVFIIIT